MTNTTNWTLNLSATDRVVRGLRASHHSLNEKRGVEA